MQIIECVPNFSEGRDEKIIGQIAEAIKQVDGVTLLDIDPGKATNRSVFTIAGPPESVIEAAFQAIKKSYELIDMSRHSGAHPRMGATDVCPLIPISNISMEETIEWAHKLGKRVGEELGLSGYYYEFAATSPDRKNLATVRAGEYEALSARIIKPEWKPDFGPALFNPKFGAIAIGARNFLVAYNVNLNTTSTRRANAIAFDVREKGRALREGNPLTGKQVLDENGEPVFVPGMLKSVKAIGWYIEEYGIAQISMNLTDITVCSLHEAYEAVKLKAEERGVRVSGSEVVGLLPKQSLIDAGKYYLRMQQRSCGIPEREIIKIAVKSMGLDELKPFDPDKKIIEYVLEGQAQKKLAHMSVEAFVHETLGESPAPGGGSISALSGAMGVALGTMVANLSAHKRGWDDKWEYFSDFASQGAQWADSFVDLVDKDTAAFDRIMDAFSLPNSSDAEKAARSEAIQKATRYAIEIPLQVMQKCRESLPLFQAMVDNGMASSLSDVGVGALCMKTAVSGAFLNVKINAATLKDKDLAKKYVAEGLALESEVLTKADALIKTVNERLEL